MRTSLPSVSLPFSSFDSTVVCIRGRSEQEKLHEDKRTSHASSPSLPASPSYWPYNCHRASARCRCRTPFIMGLILTGQLRRCRSLFGSKCQFSGGGWLHWKVNTECRRKPGGRQLKFLIHRWAASQKQSADFDADDRNAIKIYNTNLSSPQILPTSPHYTGKIYRTHVTCHFLAFLQNTRDGVFKQKAFTCGSLAILASIVQQ